MTQEAEQKRSKQRTARMHLRMPGFVEDEAIGLGDVITRVTSTVGIRPCGGCHRRAEALNRLLAFQPRRP